jgi:hypothetical protein
VQVRSLVLDAKRQQLRDVHKFPLGDLSQVSRALQASASTSDNK